MDLGLRGRTAIVCGASAGMGLAIAESFVEEGANVAMFARRRDVLEREADRLGALAVRGDVTTPRDLERLVEKTIEAFGGSTSWSTTAAVLPGAPRSASARRPTSRRSSCSSSRSSV